MGFHVMDDLVTRPSQLMSTVTDLCVNVIVVVNNSNNNNSTNSNDNNNNNSANTLS